MPILITPEVARDIAKIIRDHHGAVAAALFGKDSVSAADWEMALNLGLILPGSDVAAIAEGLHTYGAMLAHLDQAAMQSRYGMTLDQIQAEIERNPVPQTVAEHYAAQSNAHRGAQAIVGLGDKIGASVGGSLIETDHELERFMRGTIRDVVSAAHGDDEAARRIRESGAAMGLSDDFFDGQFRSTVDRQASDIGHLTGDWTRDLQRIVQTESHNAVNSGVAESWIEQEDQAAQREERSTNEVLVFKLPRPDACRYCNGLYLDGGIPRIFHLSSLRANGTNVGKRRADWMPVEGATHPWCGCTIHRVPAILSMPRGWKPGASAPSVIGAGGQLVIPGE